MGRIEGATNKVKKYEVLELDGTSKKFSRLADIQEEYNIERTTLWRHFKTGNNEFGRHKKIYLTINKL